MTEDDRDAVIDECIAAVLSLRDDAYARSAEDRESVHTLTGAACWRLVCLKHRWHCLGCDVWHETSVTVCACGDHRPSEPKGLNARS